MALATRGRYYLRRQTDGIASPDPRRPTATRRASDFAAMSPATRSSGRICWPRPSEDLTARCSTSRRWRSRSTIPIATCCPPSEVAAGPRRADGEATGRRGRGADDGGGGRHSDRDPRRAPRLLRETSVRRHLVSRPRRRGRRLGAHGLSPVPDASHLLEALAGWIESDRVPVAAVRHDRRSSSEASHARFRAFDASPAFAFVVRTRRPRSHRPATPEPTFFTRALEAMLARISADAQRAGSAPGRGHPCATSRRRSSGRECGRAST